MLLYRILSPSVSAQVDDNQIYRHGAGECPNVVKDLYGLSVHRPRSGVIAILSAFFNDIDTPHAQAKHERVPSGFRAGRWTSTHGTRIQALDAQLSFFKTRRREQRMGTPIMRFYINHIVGACKRKL